MVVSKKVARNQAVLKMRSCALVKLIGRLQAVQVTANIILVMAQQRERPQAEPLVERRLAPQPAEPLAAQPEQIVFHRLQKLAPIIVQHIRELWAVYQAELIVGYHLLPPVARDLQLL